MNINETKDVATLQLELFNHFENVFKSITGSSYQDIHNEEDIGKHILSYNSEKGPELIHKLYENSINDLKQFYHNYSVILFNQAKELGGLKIVLGGQKTFWESASHAVKQMSTYVDTQLIPDPIYPFFEGDLDLKFKYANFLLNLLYILQFKPFVELKMNCPPIFIFPSFEKTLESHDKKTFDGILVILVNLIKHFSSENINSIEELLDFENKFPDKFIKLVLENKLFIPQGESPDEHFSENELFEKYLKSLEETKSEKYVLDIKKLPRSRMLMHGITERILPQYHLLENCEELSAQPLLSQEVHWHYYTKCSEANSRGLLKSELINEETFNLIKAFQNKKFSWMSSININELALIIKNREHLDFRNKLNECISFISTADKKNINNIVKEINYCFNTLIDDHNKKISELSIHYKNTNPLNILGLGSGLLAFPTAILSCFGNMNLSTVVPSLIGSLGAGYALSKVNNLNKEMKEKQKLNKSLIGIFAKYKKVRTNL
ncbi:hypothetical protein GCL60_10000 [Silvanigrella paludirubra]|uniref:Uncharacterized protein n=1 Tax=Silvanigrella paludirubra TaxID=2499159 RepID=A0A6N6VWX1_9BACT|nr:hypothetical protein [Silvanigrella paludirubra]KAB8039179.1 hypothetical protein GCL60_10000 [Silvanigrella paludirubra]